MCDWWGADDDVFISKIILFTLLYYYTQSNPIRSDTSTRWGRGANHSTKLHDSTIVQRLSIMQNRWRLKTKKRYIVYVRTHSVVYFVVLRTQSMYRKKTTVKYNISTLIVLNYEYNTAIIFVIIGKSVA